MLWDWGSEIILIRDFYSSLWLKTGGLVGTADVIGSGDFWDIHHNTQLCVMSVMQPKLLNQSSFYPSTLVRVLQRLSFFSVNTHTLQDNSIYFYSGWAEFDCFVGSFALNCLCCQSKLMRWLRPDSCLNECKLAHLLLWASWPDCSISVIDQLSSSCWCEDGERVEERKKSNSVRSERRRGMIRIQIP